MGRVLTGLTWGHRERTSVTEICWEWGAKVRMSDNITKEQSGVGGVGAVYLQQASCPQTLDREGGNGSLCPGAYLHSKITSMTLMVLKTLSLSSKYLILSRQASWRQRFFGSLGVTRVSAQTCVKDQIAV